MSLGKHLAADFHRDTKPLESPAALAYINGIGQRFAAQVGGPPFIPRSHSSPMIPLSRMTWRLPGAACSFPSLILAVRDEDELAGFWCTPSRTSPA
jgi:hypothetical protein